MTNILDKINNGGSFIQPSPDPGLISCYGAAYETASVKERVPEPLAR